MYEHPSLTISAMLHEQEMLNRAVERRRAILERLETQGLPQRSWLERVRAAFRSGSRSVTADRPAPATGQAGAAGEVGAAPAVPSSAGARDLGAPTSARPMVSAGSQQSAAECRPAESAHAPDSDARRALRECAPAEAGILVAPTR